jgi:5'-3' exonuclease
VKLFLVDGTFELFRAYYSAPSRVSAAGASGAAGREVGALLGLLRNLARLVESPEVTHVAVAFDHVIESFRNQLFSGYKTGEGIEPALLAQFEGAERVSAALGFCTWPMVEFEADDAIATAAVRFADDPQLEGVVICSPDKDFAQCAVHSRISLWDRVRDKHLDAAGVIEKFGVPPASIPDYLALVGDTADGIPGIPRWGQKGAAAVLTRYSHIEAIPNDLASWQVSVRGAEALCRELAAQREQAMLYRTLATLRSDVPLVESLDDLRFRGVDAQLLPVLCEELGAPDLYQKLAERHGVNPASTKR